MAELTLRLLGVPEIVGVGGQVRLLRRQPLALLAYLALANGPTPRAQLALLLFGDCGERVARQRVRRLLHDLRHALHLAEVDPDIIRAEGDAIAFDHHRCAIDVARFATEANAPDATDATLALYHGPFLDGFALRNAPDMEAWIESERERLALLRLDLLRRLADQAAARGEWAIVARHAQASIAVDPLSEEAHLLLMRAHAARARRGLVRRQYDALREILRRELDAEPLPTTRVTVEALLHDHTTPPPPISPAPPQRGLVPFHGREPELATWDAAYTRVLDGTAHVTCIVGPSGVGKTRLMEFGLARCYARTSTLRVLAAGYVASPPPAPYHALIEALAPLLPEGTNPFVRRGDNDAPASEQRFWETLTNALRRLAGPAPLVLAIDDLQWADAALLRALPFLVRRLHDAPFYLVLSCRDEARPEPVVALLRWLEQLPVPPTMIERAPFGEHDVYAIVSASSGVPEPASLATALWQETRAILFFWLRCSTASTSAGSYARTGRLWKRWRRCRAACARRSKSAWRGYRRRRAESPNWQR